MMKYFIFIIILVWSSAAGSASIVSYIRSNRSSIFDSSKDNFKETLNYKGIVLNSQDDVRFLENKNFHEIEVLLIKGNNLTNEIFHLKTFESESLKYLVIYDQGFLFRQKYDENIPSTVTGIMLNLDGKSNFPYDKIEHLELRELIILTCNFIKFPEDLYNFNFLEVLSISGGEFNKLPVGLNKLSSLKYLDLHGNRLKHLNFCDLPSSLEYLDLSNNEIKEFEFEKVFTNSSLSLLIQDNPVKELHFSRMSFSGIERLQTSAERIEIINSNEEVIIDFIPSKDT